MSEQVKVTIPESLMKTIELICQSDMQPQQRLEAVILICHGYGLWRQVAVQFDPTSYAVPDRQWTQIAEWLQGTGRTITDGNAPPPLTRAQNDAISIVNLALAFMNSGPSSYKEAAA